VAGLRGPYSDSVIEIGSKVHPGDGIVGWVA